MGEFFKKNNNDKITLIVQVNGKRKARKMMMRKDKRWNVKRK